MQQMQQQPVQSASVFNVPGQPANVQYVIAVPPPPPPQPTVYPNFPKKQAVAVGVTLIVCGFLSIVFNIVELGVGVTGADDNQYYFLSWLYGYIGHGFWVGIMSVIPGGLGIAAGNYKTRKRICAFNTMCVLAASFAAAQFGIGFAGAIDGPDCYYYRYNTDRYAEGHCGALHTNAIAMEALLTILAVVEAVAAIYGSVLCCRTYCCCSCCDCETKPQSSVMPQYATPITIISGNQHLSTAQYPAVTIQSYQNVAYQPGHPSQPVQVSALPPAYSVQGQYVTASQPPNYPGINQMGNPAMVDGVPAYPSPTPVGQLQTTFASVHQQTAYSSPDQLNGGNLNKSN